MIKHIGWIAMVGNKPISTSFATTKKKCKYNVSLFFFDEQDSKKIVFKKMYLYTDIVKYQQKEQKKTNKNFVLIPRNP